MCECDIVGMCIREYMCGWESVSNRERVCVCLCIEVGICVYVCV